MFKLVNGCMASKNMEKDGVLGSAHTVSIPFFPERNHELSLPVADDPIHPVDEVFLFLRHVDELPLLATDICRSRTSVSA